MQVVGIDLFQHGGVHYVAGLDKFTGYPFVSQLRSLTTAAVTRAIKAWFHQFGYPKTIRSDGGPQFRSEFQEFCKKTQHR